MKTVHHELDVEASEGRVQDAITTEEGPDGCWSDHVVVGGADVGRTIEFTFAGDFDPTVRVDAVVPGSSLTWRRIAGHSTWDDDPFRFDLAVLDDDRVRLRFTKDYATELNDDDYGIYNFNWAYYSRASAFCARRGGGSRTRPLRRRAPFVRSLRAGLRRRRCGRRRGRVFDGVVSGALGRRRGLGRAVRAWPRARKFAREHSHLPAHVSRVGVRGHGPAGVGLVA